MTPGPARGCPLLEMMVVIAIVLVAVGVMVPAARSVLAARPARRRANLAHALPAAPRRGRHAQPHVPHRVLPRREPVRRGARANPARWSSQPPPRTARTFEPEIRREARRNGRRAEEGVVPAQHAAVRAPRGRGHDGDRRCRASVRFGGVLHRPVRPRWSVPARSSRAWRTTRTICSRCFPT